MTYFTPRAHTGYCYSKTNAVEKYREDLQGGNEEDLTGKVCVRTKKKCHPSLISLMVSVDVKHHVYLLIYIYFKRYVF